MLEKLGCRVDVAANGREAVDAVARFPYAVVFMDCQMPVMDGFEATRRIREIESATVHKSGTSGDGPVGLSPADLSAPPGLRHVPIVAMTANALTEDRQRCLAAGMDDYISKPVQSQALAAVLGRWLTVSPLPENRRGATSPAIGSLMSRP